MLPKHTKKIAVLLVVCTVATSGIAAGVYGATDIAPDAGDEASSTVGDEADSEAVSSGESRAQADGDPVEIEPGETVTGELNASPGYVFDIEPGETATIEYSLAEPTDSSMVYTSSIWAEMPDGREIPESESPRGFAVSSGETKSFNVTANEAGQVRIGIALASNDPGASGTFELSLSIEQAGDAPDGPNDDPVVIESGETVTGELDARPTYAFDIEPGETATIEYTWEAAEDSGEDSTAIEARMPDGRVVPEQTLPPSLIVESGETTTLNVTTKQAGQATINIITDISHAADRARGTYEISVGIERTGDVPDEPNDDRANATEIGLNQTKSAELDGGDLDYYAVTLPDSVTGESSRTAEVPVAVTLDRESPDGVSVLNVDTTPAGAETDTATRYVGSGAPTTVRFTGEVGERYYVAVADVEGGSGPYDLTVSANESAIEPAPPANETRSVDEISRDAYGIPFDELSDPTARLVRTVHDRQDDPEKLTKDELTQMRYEMDFDEVSEETSEEISTLYRAQFVDDSA